MKYSDENLWRLIVEQDWNLAVVREKLADPATFYPGRPILLSSQEVFGRRLFDFSDDAIAVSIDGVLVQTDPRHCFSLVESTYAKLQENLTDVDSPVGRYLTTEFSRYASLSDKRDYGFYALYLDRTGQFEGLVQFPPLPAYKLALTCSASQLYQDRYYQRSWLASRTIFNLAHIMVCGASVGSATAETILRDGRVGYLTIGDPKGPNATNFNRTTYDVFDVAGSDGSKAVSFARRMHRQDPTQIIYLKKDGFDAAELATDLAAPGRPPVDVCVEALDNVSLKFEIIRQCGQAHVPLVAISDVGSKAQLTLRDAWALDRGEPLVFGLSDRRLASLADSDLLQAAAYIVGLENSLGDEVGRYITGKINTPFAHAMPQLGSTAQVAAGQAAEEVLRYLLDREQAPFFAASRIVIDKKNHRAWTRQHPSLKERCLDFVLTCRRRLSRNS